MEHEVSEVLSNLGCRGRNPLFLFAISRSLDVWCRLRQWNENNTAFEGFKEVRLAAKNNVQKPKLREKFYNPLMGLFLEFPALYRP